MKAMREALDQIEAIEDEFQALGFKEDKWLANQGWQYTTSKMNYCWYWKKEVDGVTYMIGKSQAIDAAKRKLYLEDPETYED